MFEECTGVYSNRFYCEECSDTIEKNEDMIEFNGFFYHYDCFMDNAVEILKTAGAIKVHIRS